ncbi:TonB family protein [Pelagicoccus sp. SDUM812003]|uniref:TonB family protein n=1 Tax=Pelagicoccus sp. SDUM812003 TaxID=3041267 RepID=UPI00280F788D|nr:TonB family protein [Pelagicoccus sp. SDUM812003]MDQ8202269.1 TonB family protein [Pelagicoccus sp. SDUM812003]
MTRPTLKRLFRAAACFLALASCSAQDATEIEIEAATIASRSEVRFPATMRAIGVKEGKVSLALSIDEQGELVDAFVVESSRRAFADSALKSIETWTFEPALYNGQPFPSTVRVDLEFELDKKLRWQTFQAPTETNITQTAQIEQPITARSIEELDAIPLPLQIVEPSDELEGEVTVEFYIDELGDVRCPNIVGGTNLDFSRVVLDSVAQWRFQPPVSKGHRTNALVRQTFQHREGKLATVEAD